MRNGLIPVVIFAFALIAMGAAGCDAGADATERGNGAAATCEDGYAPCVPTYPPDVDCADVGGPITVTGSDPHGLDADGDRVGCE